MGNFTTLEVIETNRTDPQAQEGMTTMDLDPRELEVVEEEVEATEEEHSQHLHQISLEVMEVMEEDIKGIHCNPRRGIRSLQNIGR